MVERRRRRPGRGRAGDDRLQRRLRARRRQGRRGDRRSGTPRESRCAAAASRSAIFKVDEYGAPPYPELVLTDLARDARGRSGSGRRNGRGDADRGYALAVRHPERALDDLVGVGPESRPRRTGSAAPRPAPGPRAPARVRPPGAPQAWATLGPRARPARGAAGRRGLLPVQLRAELAEAASSSSTSCRQLARHPRARHDQVEPGRLGGAAGLDVDVRVEAERPGTPAALTGLRDRPRRGRRRPASASTAPPAAPRRRSTSWPAAPSPSATRLASIRSATTATGPGATRGSGAGGTLRGRSPAGPTSARPRRGPRAPRAAAARRRPPRRRAWRARP